MLVGALVFGLFLAYLEYQNQSFPTTQKPFSEYATVVASDFNGTEVYFKVEWTTSGNFTPLYAQLVSSVDAANSPVCGLGITSLSKGQTFDLPFATTAPASALSDVQLFIAVRAGSNMTEFTIEYQMGQVTAAPGNIVPSGYACSEPNQVM
jgi:hypothetical protein